MPRTKVRMTRLFLLLGLASVPLASAQDAHEGLSADEVAKQLANPNNSLAKLTFKNQYRWYEGDLPDAGDQSNYTMLFQPIFPFSLGTTEAGWKETLFVRPAFPMVFDQPIPSFANGQFDFDDETALGDIGFDLAYAQTSKDGLVWAAGLVGTLPTATDSDVAGKQWRFGPEALFGKVSDWGVVGIFPSHQWNVAGWSDRGFSTTQLQVFLNFTPGGGWVIGTTPIMDYNWQTDEWTIPIQLIVSKTTHIGKMPVQFQLEANYYIERPDAFGPEWMIGLNVTPVVSNFVEKWIRGN